MFIHFLLPKCERNNLAITDAIQNQIDKNIYISAHAYANCISDKLVDKRFLRRETFFKIYPLIKANQSK